MTLVRFTRNFAGLGQRAGADAGKEWVSGSCRQLDKSTSSKLSLKHATRPNLRKLQRGKKPKQRERRDDCLLASRIFFCVFFVWMLNGSTGGRPSVQVESFFLLAAWVDPGRSAFSQLSSGVKDAMVISTKVKCHFVTKTCKRPVETTLERGRNKKPSTNRTRTAEEGSSDVRKTTPMPERKQQHGQKMALVKPRGSTYARASVQVTRKWRI